MERDIAPMRMSRSYRDGCQNIILVDFARLYMFCSVYL